MQRLCDDCHGVYKNKASFEAHQNRTGHRQNTQAALEDSGNLPTEIASLEDSIIAKNAEIASREDSLQTYETNIANLHDEIAQLSSLEHKKDIVRTTLKNLTEEQYDLIGQQLGFVEVKSVIAPTPQTSAPVADIKPPVHEPEFFIGKKEGDGWEYKEALGFSVKY